METKSNFSSIGLMKVPKITNVKEDKSHNLTEVVSDILENTNSKVAYM